MFALSRRCLALQYKLGQVRRVATGAKSIPYLVTHDGRTIRYPDPLVDVHDTVVLEIKTGKIIDFIKFDTGNLAMVVGGRNMGRVGIVTHRERHAGWFPNTGFGRVLKTLEFQKSYFKSLIF